jgi:hypothetical protein
MQALNRFIHPSQNASSLVVNITHKWLARWPLVTKAKNEGFAQAPSEIRTQTASFGAANVTNMSVAVALASQARPAEGATSRAGPINASHTPVTALLFTMDSLKARVTSSMHGGPSGEIVVRKGLSKVLSSLGLRLEIASSDAEFEDKMSAVPMRYSFIILDSWTWAQKGKGGKLVLKPYLKSKQNHLFILDFFGGGTSLPVPENKVLTAYPTPLKNSTFLGWPIEPITRNSPPRQQGVIWGKNPVYFEGQTSTILALSKISPIHFTTEYQEDLPQSPNITYHGFMQADQWRALLSESKYFVGFGSPLAGPSALEAIAAGCVYIDSVFSEPNERYPAYLSQHPYAASKVGSPYVCSAQMNSEHEYVQCAVHALSMPALEPFVPEDFSTALHAQRVQEIFGDYVTDTNLLSHKL